MCTYVYVHPYTYIYAYAYAYVSILYGDTDTNTYTYAYTYTYICMYTHLLAPVGVHVPTKKKKNPELTTNAKLPAHEALHD